MRQVPWWVFVALAPVVYAAPVYSVPPVLAPMLKPIAAFAAIVLAVTGIRVGVRRIRARRMLERQKHLAAVRALAWRDLEELVAEAYRRQGYSVHETGRVGPDGGADLIVEKHGKFLVQCRHWKARNVGVKATRELFAAVAAERADGGVLVTCGEFTREARAFAKANALELIDGGRLLELVKRTGSAKILAR